MSGPNTQTTKKDNRRTMKALITRKVGMTSTIAEDGTLQAITLLSASPNVITQVKDVEKDGYMAVQVGFEKGKKPYQASCRPRKAS
jgi:large subunit ribosomal protein L3